MAATPIYTKLFDDSLDDHEGIKRLVEDKVRIILQVPLSGEHLRHDLACLYSRAAIGNFIIIYAYCRSCRARGMESRRDCDDCENTDDETVKFYIINKHDDAYRLLSQEQP